MNIQNRRGLQTSGDMLPGGFLLFSFFWGLGFFGYVWGFFTTFETVVQSEKCVSNPMSCS